MNIKELMEKYFKDVLKDNPDFENEINTVFESAVSEEVAKKVELKETELNASNEKEMKEFKENVVEKLDEYISLSVEEFVEENKTAIESDMKVALAEKTFSTIKTLFTEASIEIPEDQKSIVVDLEKKVETITAKLNEAVNGEIDSKKQIFEYEKTMKFVALSKDLSESAKEKLLSLLENISCENVEEYEKKAAILKENLIEKKEEKKDKVLLEDENIFEPNDLDKYLP